MSLAAKSEIARRRRLMLLCASAGVFGPLAPSLNADTVATWDGTTNNWSSFGDWSTNPNYPNNGTPPGTLYDVMVNSGSITLDVNPTIQLLNFSGGTIGGADSLTVNGLFTWSAGTIKGTITPNGGIDFHGGGSVFVSGVTLTNPMGSTATIGATGNINLYLENNGATFANAGMLNATNGNIQYDGGSVSFNNSGTFNVNEPAGTFTVAGSVPLTNSGTAEVKAGILNIAGGGSETANGSFVVDSGAILEFTGGTETFSAGAGLSGAGTVSFAGATETLPGMLNITANNLSFSNGTVNGAGSLSIGGLLTWTAGTLNVPTTANGGIDFHGGGSVFVSGVTLTNALGQTATIGATGNINLYLENNGATFANAGTLNATNGNIQYDGGSVSFNNSGTFNVNEPAGTFTVAGSVPLTNSGTAEVKAGILNIAGGGSETANGSFVVDSGAILEFTGGTETFSAGAGLSGAGTVSFAGATETLPGMLNITANNLSFSNGTVNGAGSLSIGGLLTWTAGTLNVPTTANGGIDFHGGGSVFVSGVTLTNALGQTATIGATGNINLYLENNGATFANAGTLNATNGNIQYDGGSVSFNNSGTFNVNEPAGTFTVAGSVPLTNSGTAEVKAGILNIAGGGSETANGSFVVDSGAILEFTGGTETFSAGAGLSGAGTVSFAGATETLPGMLNITANNLSFSNGTVNGAGSLSIGGLLTWTAGTLNVPTTATGGIDFHGGGSVFVSGMTLTNALGQTATIGATGNINLYLENNGATFANAGTLNATNGNIQYDGGSVSFNNSGTFNINELAGTFTVAGGITFSNSGTVNVQAGTLALQASYTGTASGALQISSGATLSLQGAFTQILPVTNNGTVQINATGTSGQITGTGKLSIVGGTVTLAAGSGISAQSAITITSGKINLTNNVLEINYGSTANDAATATAVRTSLQSGYNNDTWTGSGIVSSIAAGNPGLYAVGYADGNTDIGSPAAANQIYIENTLAGDANLDGIVNFPDLLLVAQNYGKTGMDWGHGDFNYDGIVNFPDLLLVAQNYGKQLAAGQLAQLPGSFAAQWQLAEVEVQAAGASSNVPEPASAGLFALAGLGILGRRRRKMN